MPKQKFVAFELTDGSIEVHASAAGLGFGYATFCGLDEAGDEMTGDKKTATPRKAKITCFQCEALITAARQWTRRDLASSYTNGERK